MKAIGAVIALVGAFSIYFKMQNGDQDVKKAIMLTIGGCVAFLAMSEACLCSSSSYTLLLTRCPTEVKSRLGHLFNSENSP
jgi:hypothetical protein